MKIATIKQKPKTKNNQIKYVEDVQLEVDFVLALANIETNNQQNQQKQLESILFF